MKIQFEKSTILFFVFLFLFLSGCRSAKVNQLHMGAFRLENDLLVSIRKSTDNTLRYRIFENGNTGRLFPIDDHTYTSGPGFSSKTPEVLRVEFIEDGPGNISSINWKENGFPTIQGKVINNEEWISFKSGELSLSGRLNLPDGEGPFPAIILVHGSGDDKATDYYHNGDFFAAHGIATLTFDKRGTGDSEGDYTFDYYKLAKDVIAAVDYLGTRPDIDSNRIGLSGYSQGGWVAPLAASLSDKIGFVIVNYGMIESAIEEARLETRNTLRARGVEEEYLLQVDELTLATVNVVASGFKKGWNKVDELDKKYKKASWREKMKGTTVHEFLKYPKWIIKLIGPGRSPSGLDWNYESTPILDSLDIPMVWLLPDSDTMAPNELTIIKLKEYQKDGKPFDLKIFKGTDHNMLLYEEDDGKRDYTKYSQEYFKAEVESALRLSHLSKIVN